MIMIRRAVPTIVPLLVAVWATLAVLGGAAHEAGDSGLSEGLAKAGIHFCIATVAAFAGLGLREAVARRAGASRSSSASLQHRVARPEHYRRPPPSPVPRLRLIQILRI